MSNSDKLADGQPQQQQEMPGSEEQMAPEPRITDDAYKGSDKLKGKIALITGGDSGIGRAVAVHFAREGADIAISYLEEDEDAEKTKSLVEKEGRRCVLMPGDIRSSSFCETLIEETVSKLGGLNILVNNAAEQHPKDGLEEMDLDTMEKTFQTNIFSMFYLSKFAMKHLKEGDAIINSTSVTSYRGSSHLLDYASTKGAITSFTRSLAKNVAEKGIRVNGVAPGPIWTPLIPSTFDDVSEFGQDTPLGRAGHPSEVAPAYVLLASRDGSYITGQVIHVNGGEVVGA